MGNDLVVAIDGPSGSGKSTLAKQVAKDLNIVYVNTGSMFRALAYGAFRKQVVFDQADEIDYFLSEVHFEYAPTSEVLVRVNGEDLTEKVRESEVSRLASEFSQIPAVRKYLLDFQRKLVTKQVCVMEGRDIGTVVFPNAFCKFFVTASPEIRARRRYDEFMEKGLTSQSYEEVLEDLKKRDKQDSERAVSPLRQADDADFIDTSDMNLDQAVELVTGKIKVIAKEKGISL